MKPYSWWLEVAANTRRYRGSQEKYRQGVECAAALAAMQETSNERSIDRICETFLAYRISINPNWDGSIA